MNDRLDIRPIDPHAKRVGRAHDAQGARREPVLHIAALGIAKAGMVRGRFHAGALQRGRRGFGLFPGRRVHQRPTLTDESGEQLLLFKITRNGTDAQFDVRPVESSDDDSRP